MNGLRLDECGRGHANNSLHLLCLLWLVRPAALGFGAPVLEPHLHLGLGELQAGGELPPFGSHEVRVQGEGGFELFKLRRGKGGPGSFGSAPVQRLGQKQVFDGAVVACERCCP